MEFAPLPRRLYKPSASSGAPALLGHWLIRKTENGFCGGAIVEVEAYLVDDPAAHGFIGETARNRVMYGPPGYAYVYFIYGVHFCVNAVCHRVGMAEAVLIRAIEADFGEDLMRRNRAAPATVSLSNGPGKLCAALDIDRKLNGADLCDERGTLFIAANPNWKTFRKQRGPLTTSTRIGVSRAAHLPLRFHLAGSAFISRPVRTPSPPSTAPSARRGAARPAR